MIRRLFPMFLLVTSACTQKIPEPAQVPSPTSAPALPGDVATAQVRIWLAVEVSRQIKPHWKQPDGKDVDKLATTMEWNLNPDGSLSGTPRFVSQSGVNSANAAQAGRHREQAIRAIRLSSPFTLPPKHYAVWRHLRFTFDWKPN